MLEHDFVMGHYSEFPILFFVIGPCIFFSKSDSPVQFYSRKAQLAGMLAIASNPLLMDIFLSQ